jgi:hypothetical protein
MRYDRAAAAGHGRAATAVSEFVKKGKLTEIGRVEQAAAAAIGTADLGMVSGRKAFAKPEDLERVVAAYALGRPIAELPQIKAAFPEVAPKLERLLAGSSWERPEAAAVASSSGVPTLSANGGRHSSGSCSGFGTERKTRE